MPHNKPTGPGRYLVTFDCCSRCRGTGVIASKWGGGPVSCAVCGGSALEQSGWVRLEDTPEFLALKHDHANLAQVVEWLMARVEALEGKGTSPAVDARLRDLELRVLPIGGKRSKRPAHICGLRGYGAPDDPPCPGCEAAREAGREAARRVLAEKRAEDAGAGRGEGGAE